MARHEKREDAAGLESPAHKKESTTLAVSSPHALRNINSGPFENASQTYFTNYDVGPSTPQNIDKKFLQNCQAAGTWMLELMSRCKEMTVLCVLVKRGKIDVLSHTEEEDFWTWYDCSYNSDMTDVSSTPSSEDLAHISVYAVWSKFAAVVMHQLDHEFGPSWPADLHGELSNDFSLKLRLVNVVSGLFYKLIARDGSRYASVGEKIADGYMREMNWEAETTLKSNICQLVAKPQPESSEGELQDVTLDELLVE